MGSMSMMLQEEEETGHFELVLQRLLVMLSTAGGVVTVIVFIYLMAGPPQLGFGDTISFCVVLLIASIPIALKVRSLFTL